MWLDMKTGERRNADISQQYGLEAYVLVTQRERRIHETAGDDCYLAIHEPSINGERKQLEVSALQIGRSSTLGKSKEAL